jgi:hypothetical protein
MNSYSRCSRRVMQVRCSSDQCWHCGLKQSDIITTCAPSCRPHGVGHPQRMQQTAQGRRGSGSQTAGCTEEAAPALAACNRRGHAGGGSCSSGSRTATAAIQCRCHCAGRRHHPGQGMQCTVLAAPSHCCVPPACCCSSTKGSICGTAGGCL